MNDTTMITINTQVRQPLWKRILRSPLGIIFLVPIGLLSAIAFVNYTGYCSEQSRYLTDEERIRRAVQFVLGAYPDITYAYDKLPKAGYEVVQDKSRCCGQGDMSRLDKSSGGSALEPEQLILYRDIDEFFAINPDCCSFTRNGLYGELGSTGLWMKLVGDSAGFVSIKYRVRYHDEAGNVRVKFSGDSWNITNCGRQKSPFE